MNRYDRYLQKPTVHTVTDPWEFLGMQRTRANFTQILQEWQLM